MCHVWASMGSRGGGGGLVINSIHFKFWINLLISLRSNFYGGIVHVYELTFSR